MGDTFHQYRHHKTLKYKMFVKIFVEIMSKNVVKLFNTISHS